MDTVLDTSIKGTYRIFSLLSNFHYQNMLTYVVVKSIIVMMSQ